LIALFGHAQPRAAREGAAIGSSLLAGGRPVNAPRHVSGFRLQKI
jgi:hypothetical protein